MSNENKKIKIELSCVDDLTIEANGTYSIDVTFKVSIHQLEHALEEAKKGQRKQ